LGCRSVPGHPSEHGANIGATGLYRRGPTFLGPRRYRYRCLPRNTCHQAAEPHLRPVRPRVGRNPAPRASPAGHQGRDLPAARAAVRAEHGAGRTRLPRQDRGRRRCRRSTSQLGVSAALSLTFHVPAMYLGLLFRWSWPLHGGGLLTVAPSRLARPWMAGASWSCGRCGTRWPRRVIAGNAGI
jgi:hypothetical protein